MSSRKRWIDRCAKRTLIALAAGSVGGGLLNSAHAQNGGTWTYNGNTNWSDAGAWFGGTIPDGPGSFAGLLGAGIESPLDTLTVTLDTNRTVGTLSFGDTDGVNSPAGWLLRQTGGSVLTLEATTGDNPQATLNANNLGAGNGTSQVATLFQKIANINANLAGVQGFNKTGGGTALLTGNNSGLSGSIILASGNLLFGSANALGSATLLTQRTGQLAFRGDTAANYSGTNIVLQSDSTLGTGNSIGTNGLYGTGVNLVHTLGNVTIDNYGVRTVGISGSNGYGLNIGILGVRDGINLINQGSVGSISGAGDNNNVNGAGSGLVTIGTISYSGTGAGTINLSGVGSMAGNITVANGITNLGAGSAALVYSGTRTATINGPIGTGGDTYVTGGTTGTTAAGNFQAGLGTLILGSGALPNNKAVYINGGTMLLNGGALTHTVNGITLGGATVTSGAVPAFLNSGAGTVALGGGIIVSDSVLFNPSTTVSTANATAGTIAGRLDLGASNRSIAVTGISTLTVDGVVSGTGGIIKSGTGALILTNTNTFTGSIDLQDGVAAGSVKAVGNSLGATGANVSLGGALRLNGIGSAGTGTVNTLTSKDTGKDSGLIVDASAGGATTLNINIFGGREANTRGTIKVVPVTGSLDTNEIVHMSTGAPATTNGILPAYFAVQNSGTNTGLGFAGLSSNRIVAFSTYQTGDINAASTVYDLAASSTQAIGGGGKTLYAARIGGNSSVTGGALTLGNGTSGFGGLILNGGAFLNNSILQQNGTDELVIWSGGVGVNSISSNLNLTGDLTTGGSTALQLSGTTNFNAVTRNISVTGATVTFSNASALGNTGNFVKKGGGVLVFSGDNLVNTGTIGIESGTLQIGAGGATGSVGTGTILNNANITFNRNNTVGSYSNAIGGSGNLWVNATSAGIVTLSGPLTYTGNTTVQTGILKPAGSVNRLPTGTTLRVESGATFDLNGLSTTVAQILGAGTIANTVAGTTTLTINGGGTFTGSIRNAGAGSLALVKSGSGTLILAGPNAFNGTISITGGTLQVNTAASSSSGGGFNPNIVLNNGALALNNPNNSNLTNANLIFLGNSTISVLTNPPVNLGQNQDGAGPGLQSGANSWQGNGTVNLVLGGRMLNIGDQAFTGNVNQLTAFTGTLKFDDSNPVGSRVRFTFGGGGAAFTAGSPGATFAFGNGFNLIQHRFGTALFNMGFVSGGTNTILEGHTNDAGRSVTYNFGLLPGDQTFHGQIRDNTTQGAIGIVHASKTGSGSLTLKNTLAFTGGLTVNSGTLVLASGVNITNSASLGINGGTLAILPGASFSSSRIIATVGGGALDVSAFGTFPTPGRMTYTGGGTVYGNVNHNAGSINPGSIGGPGTLTFSNNLNLSNGSVDFDLNPGSVNLLGGTNDVLRVNTANGLTISSGIIRLNFVGASTTPPPSLATGQFYPIISYNSTYTGLPSNIFTTAKFRGSFELQQGTGSLSSTLGAKIISLGGSTVNLVWKPISSEFNAWDAAVGFTNFKPLVGSGSLFFFSGDSVTFDDSTTIRTVQITPGLAPSSMTVNTAGTYIFTGQGFGSITGSTSLVKNGTGTLWLSGDNDYTGGTTINAGTLVVGDPFSPQLTPRALGGGNATTTFNGNSNFQIFSPTSNTFAGPGGAPGVGAVGLTGDISGGTFVFNGNHRIILNSSNIMHPFNINMFGSGTITVQRPSLDGNNTHLWFNTGNFPIAPGSATTVTVNPFANFTGTIKLDDATNVAAGGGGQGWTQFRDGTILRMATGYTTAGNPSMIIDLGLGTAGFSLGGAGHVMTIGAIRGGPNTFFKQDNLGAAVAAGTYNIAGVGSQYNSTFNGVFRANGNNTVNASTIQLVNVVKSGSLSTLTLTNQQPYVGSTIVNGGTLALVNASANPLTSPTITVGTAGVLDVSGLSGGGGTFVLNANQRIISNGSVVGSELQVVSTSTVGGTNYNIPVFVSDGATISPGNSVGTMTVGNLVLDGAVDFLIEVDQTGIDTLVLSGVQTALIVNAQSKLNLVNLGGFVPGTYTLLDYSGDPSIQSGIEGGFVPGEFAYQVNLVHDSANTRVLLQVVNNSAQWFVNSDGQWSTAPNWTLDGTNAAAIVPNSVTFGTFISAPRTVTTNSVIGNTANSMVFDSPVKYTIGGTGTLTLDSGIVAPITVLQGTHVINAPVRALRTIGLSVASSSTISFGGTIINANNAGLNKLGAGTASFARLNMPGGTLSVGAGTAVMSVKPTANSVVGTSVLANMTISGGAKLDLTNNAVILDYTGAIGNILTDLRSELQDGRLFSSSVDSTKTVGYRSNNTGTTPAGGTATAGLGQGTVASFGGVAADNTTVLIRVTYKGDSNLDGIVNVLDLFNLSQNWLSTNGVWAGGDFNFDGIVNQADLGILSQNWQLGNNNPLPGEDLGAALTAAGIPLSAVPEPGAIALIGAGMLSLLPRRRRR